MEGEDLMFFMQPGAPESHQDLEGSSSPALLALSCSSMHFPLCFTENSPTPASCASPLLVEPFQLYPTDY